MELELTQNGCETVSFRGCACATHIRTGITRKAHQPGGEMLLPLHSQQPSKILHPGVEVYPDTKLPLPSDCKVEDKQRGLREPRDTVAAAVPEECHQQDEEIQTGRLIIIVPHSPSYALDQGAVSQQISLFY